MIVREHSDPAAFLLVAQPMLERREAFNGLLLGIAMMMSERQAAGELDASGKHLWVTVEDADTLVLAGVMVSPRQLILSAGDRQSAEGVAPLVQHLAPSHWNVTAVNGPSATTLAFADCWQGATGTTMGVGMHQGIYELRQVRHPRQAPGTIRSASLADLDLITQWMVAYHQEVGLQVNTEKRAVREMVKRRLELGTFVLWEDDDQHAVSCAARDRPTRHGATVNAVYTPPPLRGRGYATACVAALSQQILDSGKTFCTLLTDLSNPTSNNIYQAIGYELVGDFCEYRAIT